MGTEISAGQLSELRDGILVGMELSGHKVVLAREGDDVFAALDKCPHMGLAMSGGPGGMQYAGGIVQCPWHNSRFEIKTGHVLDWCTGFGGKKTPGWTKPLVSLGLGAKDLVVLPTRVENGEVFVVVD
jgi:nitrite reductase/ring-hydroxylating ferredoxin subunit